MKSQAPIGFSGLLLMGLAMSLPANAAFVIIPQPNAAYTSTTTLLPITDPPGTAITSISDGAFTASFSSPDAGNSVIAQAAVPVGWLTWNIPPAVETSTPRVLQDQVNLACATCTLVVNFSQPVKTFGFEAEPDPFPVPHTITATFFNGAMIVGAIPIAFPTGVASARLFAATTDQQFTSVVITVDGADFAIAQLRYGLIPVPADAYQVSYVSNLLSGDSVVNITNSGVRNGFDPAGGICANVYAFDPSEELVACCSCYVTPDGLQSLSVKQDLVSNTLTPGVPGSLVIKLLASSPIGVNTCNASAPVAFTLGGGLRAWSTNLHQNTATGKFEQTENVFSGSVVSPTELTKLTTYCGFIQANGSGFGICKSCRLGGLGGAQQ